MHKIMCSNDHFLNPQWAEKHFRKLNTSTLEMDGLKQQKIICLVFIRMILCIEHVFLIEWLWVIYSMIKHLVNRTFSLLVQSHKQFEEVFKRTVLGEYFESVDKKMQKEFFQRYLQDFVALTMKVSAFGEQQVS